MVFYIIEVIVVGTLLLNKFTSIVIPPYFRFNQMLVGDEQGLACFASEHFWNEIEYLRSIGHYRF